MFSFMDSMLYFDAIRNWTFSGHNM